jgi:hypothetical protein
MPFDTTAALERCLAHAGGLIARAAEADRLAAGLPPGDPAAALLRRSLLAEGGLLADHLRAVGELMDARGLDGDPLATLARLDRAHADVRDAFARAGFPFPETP